MPAWIQVEELNLVPQTNSESPMSTVHISRGTVLATAAAAIFTAGCSNQQEQADKAVSQTTDQMQHEGTGMMKGMKSQARESASEATEVKVACFGINACKGQSECATPNNACKGLNSCKGQGYLYVSLKECEAQGGRVIKPKM